MALITCPECSKEISDKAVACPGCGYPLNQASTKTQENELQCPDFPADISVGELIKSLVGDSKVKVIFSLNDNSSSLISAEQAKMVPPNGKVILSLCQYGIRMYVPLLGVPINDIHSSQLISLKETTQQEITQIDKSIIGRAVVGGLILGPIGAIIGGITGTDKTRMKNQYILIINFWNIKTKKPESLLVRSDNKLTQFINKVKGYALDNNWGLSD